jgi:hypothetical protein
MKSIAEYIVEGNITNIERHYRDFCQICAGKGYSINDNDIEVAKTSKGNWNVYINGTKKFLVSSAILNDETVEKYKLGLSAELE